MMGWNPYDEALFSDYQDHLSEEAYHNHLAMQESAKVTKPSPLFRIRAYPRRSVAAAGGLDRAWLPLLKMIIIAPWFTPGGLVFSLTPCRTM